MQTQQENARNRKNTDEFTQVEKEIAMFPTPTSVAAKKNIIKDLESGIKRA